MTYDQNKSINLFLKSGELTFIQYSVTEVNENEWGTLFFNSVNLNYNQESSYWESRFTLNDGVLRIYYSDEEYMSFTEL